MENQDNNFKNTLVLLVLAAGLILFAIYLIMQKSSETEKTTPQQITELEEVADNSSAISKTYSTPPEMQLTENVDYKAVITTSKGVVEMDLFEKDAPMTVNNFVFLAREGFYDGVTFHRVIKDFMIQTGNATETGGPGYTFEDEINDIKLVEGSVAMANAGPNTNGSQFFIVTAESTPWLDGKHTNFGEVTKGMNVVTAIGNTQTDPEDKPLEPITVETVEIIEN